MAKFCAQCGAPIEGARFCPQCGAPVASEEIAPTTEVAPNPTPTNHNKILIAIIATLLVALLAELLALHPWATNTTSTETSSSTATSSEVTSEDAVSSQPAASAAYSFTLESINGESAYSYLRVFSDTKDAFVAFDPLNARWKAEAEKAYANKYTPGATPTAESNTSHGNGVTYFADGIAGVDTSTYLDSGGPHGELRLKAAVYNLKTGEASTAYD